MDSIFQSLLLTQSSLGPSPSQKDENGGTDVGGGGGGNPAGSCGSGALLLNNRTTVNRNSSRWMEPALPPPRPSRYAQLLPREALRLTPGEDMNGIIRHEDHYHGHSKSRGGGEGEDKLNKMNIHAANKGGRIESFLHVYRKDDITGHLVKLLPEHDYDVVIHDYNSHVEEKEEEEVVFNKDNRIDEEDDVDDKMLVDENDKNDIELMTIHDDDDDDDNSHRRQDTIYVVKTKIPSTQRLWKKMNQIDVVEEEEEGGGEAEEETASSSSSSLDLLPQHNNNNHAASIVTSSRIIHDASTLASSLSRALVVRTPGIEKFHPSYEIIREQERERLERQEKKKSVDQRISTSSTLIKQKKKKKTKESKTEKQEGERGSVNNINTKKKPLSVTNSKQNDVTAYENNSIGLRNDAVGQGLDTSGGGNDRNATGGKHFFRYSMSTDPNARNLLCGDSPKTLHRLARVRQWQEQQIDSCTQGIELENWEDKIDWEGADDQEEDTQLCDHLDEKDEDIIYNDQPGKNKDEEKINSVNKQEKTSSIGCINIDDNPIEDDQFIPPHPIEGCAKRPKRISSRLYWHGDDPMQLLYEPYNPRLDTLDLSTAVNWQGARSDSEEDYDEDHDNEATANIPLILHSSIAGRSVAALLAPNPMSRPLPFDSHPNYLQRYERDMASEIISTADLAKSGGIMGENNEALEKYKEARQRKREQMAKDKQSRVTEVMSALSLTGTGRRITSSLMGPGGAERSGRPNRHALGSSMHDAEYVEQLELVHNHSLVKPALSKSEYRQFHRPRLPLIVVDPLRPWQFQVRVDTDNKLGGTRGAIDETSMNNSDGSTIVGSYHSMISTGSKGQSKIRNENDLSPSMGDLVVLEYCEERPPLFMSKGTTCRIVNYFRGDRSKCPISAGGGDRPLRKRHGDKAASAKGSTPSGPPDRVERPPRLVGPNQYTIQSVSDLIGIFRPEDKKGKESADPDATKKKKEIAVDMLPEGVTEIIHQKSHGPFLGEVEEGTTQTGLICNLFAAPIFRHDSKPNDFLMILGQLQDRSRTGIVPSADKQFSPVGLSVILRPLPPNIYCVGQTEPRVKVFAPNTNDERKFVNAFVPYQVARHIQRAEEVNNGCGLTFDFISDTLFRNSNIPRGQLRQRIKQVANFERGNSGIWSLKALGEDNFPGVEVLGRKVSPEGIAAYESQCAAIRRFQDLGIKELYLGGNTVANVAAMMIYLNGTMQGALERKLKMKKVLEIKKRQKALNLDYFEKALEKLDAEYREIKRRQEIAKFIYEELQLSPWNTSGDFIEVHKKAVGGARMKLTGIGDPSGVGEGYNFLRETDTRANKSISTSDVALNAQIKKITGTQNDLRKLTMKQMASLLRSYGMKDKQINVLKRWDRVHVIRDLSTKAASDGMGDDMERFARGEKLRISDQRHNYKERIQEIWRRQVAALSADTGNGISSRSEMASESFIDGIEADRESDTAEENAESDESDSSGDDDFLNEIEMEMANTGEANRLVSGLRDKSGAALDSQGLSKDARDFAALQRQRIEERAMHAGLEQHNEGIVTDKQKKKQKVIRRKITKTSPDGTQSVSFEFIVDREKVEDIIARLTLKESGEKKKKKLSDDHRGDVGDTTCVGHATFEDEDNAKTKRGIIKFKVKKEVHVSRKKVPGPKKASEFKLSSSIKHSQVLAKENRKKKLRKQEEEAELYKSHVRGKGTSNRKERGSARDRMPHVILADRLESLRSAVEARPTAGAFLKPVPRELFPNYYEVIHEPIDLSTIREKIRKYGYSTADDFEKDFQLMKNNAIKFNGKGSPLANEAVEIWTFVKNTIVQNRDEFEEMEEAVREQKSGKKKKKKSKIRSASESSDQLVVDAMPMNTANIVLDGIETKVNLGTNVSFGLGGDSDDEDNDSV